MILSSQNVTKIYNNFRKQLLIYIYYFVRSQDTAEDILHDAFVNLIKYSNHHTIQLFTVKAFLYKTCHNLSINYLKKQSRIFYVENRVFDYISSKRGNLNSEVECDELINSINSIIDTMDYLSRSIFFMKVNLEMHDAEIAEILGKTKKTIYNRLVKITIYLEANLKNQNLFYFK